LLLPALSHGIVCILESIVVLALLAWCIDGIMVDWACAGVWIGVVLPLLLYLCVTVVIITLSPLFVPLFMPHLYCRYYEHCALPARRYGLWWNLPWVSPAAPYLPGSVILNGS
jgi:hypothetical protein